MDNSFLDKQNLNEILNNKHLAKFGDSVVNFVYSYALFKAYNILTGIKVSDYCLSEACKTSPLRNYVGTRKKKGELGDAVEAFIGYIVIQNESKLLEIVSNLVHFLKMSKMALKQPEDEICVKVFSFLLNKLFNEL
ncbi:MAG: hypothetical protein K9W45_07940 [Candidatus Heimdallarchaeum aukensis]|uniref:RNase III domain-containing protein n=1 Tax=Candidatus Heimdallarchaeum aukensis TaxID=2876573 RepID=A0A9Y1BJ06_9ARCH|nr:MAG: hypothetical protein K9W45_07940 [Candidatus Heimdallarchaeum aukensis]